MELEYHDDNHNRTLGGLLPQPPKPTDQANKLKKFLLRINASDYPHATAITEHPLYRGWPDERSPFDVAKHRLDSLALNALQLSIPDGPASKALRDWDTNTTPYQSRLLGWRARAVKKAADERRGRRPKFDRRPKLDAEAHAVVAQEKLQRGMQRDLKQLLQSLRRI